MVLYKQTTLTSQLISNMKHNKSITRQAFLSVCVRLSVCLPAFPLGSFNNVYLCVHLSFCLPNCCLARLPIHLPNHYVFSLLHTSVRTTQRHKPNDIRRTLSRSCVACEHNDTITEQQHNSMKIT